MIALSKHPRKVTSGDVPHIYIGEIYAVGEPLPIHMESTNDDVFEITYYLDVPVRDDIYDYITGE